MKGVEVGQVIQKAGKLACRMTAWLATRVEVPVASFEGTRESIMQEVAVRERLVSPSRETSCFGVMVNELKAGRAGSVQVVADGVSDGAGKRSRKRFRVAPSPAFRVEIDRRVKKKGSVVHRTFL